jgi:hypothetical protein
MAGLAVVARAETVDGTVIRRDTGVPLAGARVKLDQPEMDPHYAKTDSNGHFEFPGLRSVDGSLSVEFPGFIRSGSEAFGTLPFPTLFHENQPVFEGVKLVRSKGTDGTTRVTATISLHPVAAISGRVTGPNGVPLPGTRIQIFEKKSSQATRTLPDGTVITDVATATADDRGEFRASFLFAGTYYLLANATGPRDLRPTYYPHWLDSRSAQAIRLAAGQQVRIDFHVLSEPGVRVAGRFLGMGALDPEARKALFPDLVLAPTGSVRPDRPYEPVISGDQFELPGVLPGKYTLHLIFRKSGLNGPILGARRDIQVGETSVTDLMLEVQKLPDISGTVQFAQGCSAVPVRATAGIDSPLMQMGSLLGAVDAQGKFTIPSLPPGRIFPRLGSPEPNQPGPSEYWAKIGDRDVIQGFEYPSELTGPLKFVVGCPGMKRSK